MGVRELFEERVRQKRAENAAAALFAAMGGRARWKGVTEEAKKAALSKAGKRGGRRRWRGVSKQKRREHALKMVAARQKKGKGHEDSNGDVGGNS